MMVFLGNQKIFTILARSSVTTPVVHHSVWSALPVLPSDTYCGDAAVSTEFHRGIWISKDLLEVREHLDPVHPVDQLRPVSVISLVEVCVAPEDKSGYCRIHPLLALTHLPPCPSVMLFHPSHLLFCLCFLSTLYIALSKLAGRHPGSWPSGWDHSLLSLFLQKLPFQFFLKSTTIHITYFFRSNVASIVIYLS